MDHTKVTSTWGEGYHIHNCRDEEDFKGGAKKLRNKKEDLVKSKGRPLKGEGGDAYPNSSDAKVGKFEFLKKGDKKKKDQLFMKEKK